MQVTVQANSLTFHNSGVGAADNRAHTPQALPSSCSLYVARPCGLPHDCISPSPVSRSDRSGMEGPDATTNVMHDHACMSLRCMRRGLGSRDISCISLISNVHLQPSHDCAGWSMHCNGILCVKKLLDPWLAGEQVPKLHAGGRQPMPVGFVGELHSKCVQPR